MDAERFTSGQKHPRPSRSGVELVKRFEGLRHTAARLEGGGWTIGYGHTASAREGAQVGPEDAEALLIYDLNRVARTIDEAVYSPLNQNQFDALAAFVFNVGAENFRRSNVLKRLNEGDYLQAAAALELWRRARLGEDSIVVDALVRRRAAEKALFLTPVDGFRPVPTPLVRAEFDALAPEPGRADEGLGQAADVRASMQGDTAVAEVHPSEAPAALAARKVADRLNALFPDDGAAVAEEAAPPPFPDELPSDTVAEPEPTPEPVHEPQPFVRRFPAPVEDDPLAGDVQDAFVERIIAPEPEPPAPGPKVVSAEPEEAGSSLAELASGVFGAALFAGALATIILGRATFVNLGLGLLGVLCIAPWGWRLLNRLFTRDDA